MFLAVLSLIAIVTGILLTAGSAFAMPEATTPFKRDVGYSVKNGVDGSTFLNSFPECAIGADEAAMTLADLVTRYANIATSLNLLYNSSHTAGRVVKVVKINHPMYEASMQVGDTKGAVKKLSYIASIREINNHANTIKHSGSFVGIPADVATEELRTSLSAALLDLYGKCADGTTDRFVGVVWVGEKTITKE
jgi:hypothetical protein